MRPLGMQLPAFLLRWLRRLYRAELDPDRANRVYREYDVERGYARYHEVCRAQFQRSVPPDNGSLAAQGFHYLNVLDEGSAETIIRRVESEHDLSYVKKDTKDLKGFHLGEEMIAEILASVLTAAVDRQLVGFFRSEYLVHWVTCTVTPRADEQASVSFRWHCDKGPRAHLKLLVYLNATEEHGGNTEFIGLEDTSSVAARGYLFGWTQARSSDVNDISRIAGRIVESRAKSMQTGEGVIFQPASVLHRGITPRRGARYVITLCLLPSPVHWTVALERGATSDLAEDAKWHKDAGQLLQRIDQPAT